MELFERDESFKKSLDDLYLSKQRNLKSVAVVEDDDDTAGQDTTIAPYPNTSDVLLGKGRCCQEFPGNQALLKLVATRYLEYQGASKDEKATIAKEVVASIHRSGGRFLEVVEAVGWKVVTDGTTLRNKVTQAFRAQKRNQKSDEKGKHGDPSTLLSTVAASTDQDESDDVGAPKKPRRISDPATSVQMSNEGSISCSSSTIAS